MGGGQTNLGGMARRALAGCRWVGTITLPARVGSRTNALRYLPPERSRQPFRRSKVVRRLSAATRVHRLQGKN